MLQVSSRVLGWQSGQLPVQVRRLNTTWSRKLSDSLVTQQPSTSTTKLEEGIVGVDEGSATQQNCVRDYVIFQFLPILHQDYTGITLGLHRDYTDF